MASRHLACSVCDKPVNRYMKGPAVVIKALKYYEDFRRDSGDPTMRKELAYCNEHIDIPRRMLNDTASERKRLAEEKGNQS